MQVVCEILTSDQMNQNEESIAEISQALDTSTEEEEPSDEEEDDDSMVFSLYPLHELYALALEKMDESRSIVSGQIVCTFTGLSTEQLLLVIVQPFLFWFRFPSHFWFMTNVPKYFRKNHIIVRVSLQDGMICFS